MGKKIQIYTWEMLITPTTNFHVSPIRQVEPQKFVYKLCWLSYATLIYVPEHNAKCYNIYGGEFGNV